MRKLVILSLFLGLLLASFNIMVWASSPTQSGTLIPTLTPNPVEDASYEISMVGGDPAPLIFDGASDDILLIGQTTAASLYPRGMVFSVGVQTQADDIESVRLTLTFLSGEVERFSAEFDEANQVWLAHAWSTGASQPAWTPFSFIWTVRDTDGNELSTEPQDTIYWDANHVWYRIELETFIAYAYDFEEIYSPEEFAERLNEAVVSTEPRRIAGFGGELSYKPIAVYYARQSDLAEITGSGFTNTTAGAYAVPRWGLSVQIFDADRDGETEPNSIWDDCVWAQEDFGPVANNDDITPAQASLNWSIYNSTPHEITHLYQADFETSGPTWWMEGQGDFFTHSTYEFMPFDARLQYLATLNPLIPNMEGDNLPRNTAMADGCIYLVYQAGFSFINWFVGNYGIEAHAEVIAFNQDGMNLYEAIAEVTGEEFWQIENKWRDYIGFDVLTLADVDPEAALSEPIDARYAVGDTVTFGATPLQVKMLNKPGPQGAPLFACFANTEVTITKVGSLDDINYYQVDCQGIIGWVLDEQLP